MISTQRRIGPQVSTVFAAGSARKYAASDSAFGSASRCNTRVPAMRRSSIAWRIFCSLVLPNPAISRIAPLRAAAATSSSEAGLSTS